MLDGIDNFFIQQRVGKNNKNFKIIKFRTMVNKIDYDTQSFDLVTMRDYKIKSF